MYKHTQRGRLLINLSITLIAASVIAGYMGDRGLLLYPLGLVGLFLFLCFRDLTVEVNDTSVRLTFGVGWIKKEIKLDTVEAVFIVRNPWWYGLGIKYMRRGWLYNIGGLDAVELQFKNGKRARIGTDEPRVLQTEIFKRLVRPENKAQVSL
jgi:hypothetical protein